MPFIKPSYGIRTLVLGDLGNVAHGDDAHPRQEKLAGKVVDRMEHVRDAVHRNTRPSPTVMVALEQKSKSITRRAVTICR